MSRVLRKLNQHRTTEVYFIGYPKTGTTWLQFLLGNYIQEACSLTRMPLFDQTDGLGRCAKHCVGPAMYFTHRPLRWESQTASDLNFQNVIQPFVSKRVVFIVRHPLDVLVSHWFQERHQVQNRYSGELPEYIAHPVFGLEKLLHFYSLWHENSGLVKGFYLIRYEDLRSSPTETFASLLGFLNIQPDNAVVASAIEKSSFESMRALEKTGNVPTIPSSGLRVFATGDRNNPDSYHVRRGKVGGYRDYLSDDLVQELELRIARSVGAWLGYGANVSARGAKD